MTNHPNRTRAGYPPECIPPLVCAGIDIDDAFALRRIAMQLHRWHELECGVESGHVEHDDETGLYYWYNAYSGRRTPFYNGERGPLKRLAAVMAKYPTLSYYVQSDDARGAALYILRPGDVPEGKKVDVYYSRGLAVYR